MATTGGTAPTAEKRVSMTTETAEVVQLREEMKALRREFDALRTLKEPFTSSRRPSLSDGRGGGRGSKTQTPSNSTPSSPKLRPATSGAAETPGVTTTAPSTKRKPPMSLFGYICKEVVGAQSVGAGNDNVESHEMLDNFLHIPTQLESVIAYGFILCFDTFLYTFTVLPLRVLHALYTLVMMLVRPRSADHRFRRTHAYDAMRGAIMLIVCRALQEVQFGVVYHTMKTQSAMKLYVVTAMVEISDKLLCSLGQDILDSLYYTVRYHPHRYYQLIGDFIVAVVFNCMHAMLFFLHVVSLEVAMSHKGSILLTLLISNNFAELKSSVFKKFTEGNLLQITCSDIVERFKLVVFLTLILFLNFVTNEVGAAKTAGFEDWWDNFWHFAVAVFCSEVVVDWVKHAFITKFNKIKPSVYSGFSASLCHHMTTRCQKGRMLDHNHAVSRRLGLLAMPLVCLTYRFVTMSLQKLSSSSVHAWHSYSLGVVLWLCLCLIKMLTSILLLGNACRWTDRMESKGHVNGQHTKLGTAAKIEHFVMRSSTRDWKAE